MTEEKTAIDEKEVYGFPISESAEVRFRVKKYRGQWYVDIRLYAESEGGERKYPTKKGVMVRDTAVPELLKGIGLMKEALVSTTEAVAS